MLACTTNTYSYLGMTLSTIATKYMNSDTLEEAYIHTYIAQYTTTICATNTIPV